MVLMAGTVVMAGLLLASLLTGSVALGAGDFWAALQTRLGGMAEGAEATRNAVILFDLRLPRALVAMAAGAGLGLAGACMQGLFRNPLADPGLVGVSSGAALGGMAAILMGARLSLPEWLEGSLLPVAAALSGWATTWLLYRLSRRQGRADLATLLLAGLAINALAAALLGLAIFTASDFELRRFTFWTLGSLAQAGWPQALLLVACLSPALVLLIRGRRELDALLLGEAEAFHLGVDVVRLQRRLILLTALITGLAVACCGIVGFVGLIVPHLVRRLTGPLHQWVLPGAAIYGAGLLLLADLAARTLAAPAELPLGVLTALVGAPFFLYLLMRERVA